MDTKRARILLVGLGWSVLCAACAAPDPGHHAESGEPARTTDASLDPDDPSILRRPFTAEQIREAWAPGLVIDVHRYGPEGDAHERWTVVSADAEGADIEYAALDGSGEPTGKADVQRALWVELRDHATFPAASSTVEDTTLDTSLGTLEGWLYTTRDEEAGTVTELFFARDLPGAPVEVTMKRGEEVVMEMAQISRTPPG